MSEIGWFAASLAELKELLDEIGEKGEVSLTPGDDAVAAIIGMLNAAPILYAASAHAAAVVNTLDVLEQTP